MSRKLSYLQLHEHKISTANLGKNVIIYFLKTI